MKFKILFVLGTFCLYSSMGCQYIPLSLISTGNIVESWHSGDYKVYNSENSWLNSKNTKILLGKKDNSPPKVLTKRKNELNQNQYSSITKDIYNKIIEMGESPKVLVESFFPNKPPSFMRGIYLSNNTIWHKRLDSLMKRAKLYGINSLIIDVQPKRLGKEKIKNIIESGFYPVARVVVYEGGFRSLKPPIKHLQNIFESARLAMEDGFAEIQLDYIRYADNRVIERLPLKIKYAEIEKILIEARKLANKYSVQLSADLFGRITLNKNDHIGQKLENFAKYMDAIYPMVYPSHYTNDSFRINNPYNTVKEGVEKSLARIPKTRIIPYIQGFKMKIPKGMNMSTYIAKQMKASEDGGADGWVLWNPRNIYESSFIAMESIKKQHFKNEEREKRIN